MSAIFYVLISIRHLALASASSTFQAVSYPGDVPITECATMGGEATVWQGTTLQCGSSINEIIPRDSQLGLPEALELSTVAISLN